LNHASPSSIQPEEKKKLSRLLLQIPEPVFLVDLSQNLLCDANPSFLELFELTESDIQKLSLEQIFTQSSLQKFTEWSPSTPGEDLQLELFPCKYQEGNSFLTVSFVWENPWAPDSALAIIQGFHPLQSSHQVLQEENSKLEEMVNTRTHELLETNDILRQTLNQLRGSQVHLVESQKMEALTQLVSGIAHEINTPLGSGITAMSFLGDRSKKFRQKVNSGPILDRDWGDFLDDFSEVEELVIRSFQRIKELVVRFKEVAVNQSEGQLATFQLDQFMEDLEISLKMELDEQKHDLQLNFPKDILLTTYAQALNHVLRQMVLNSLHHGYLKGERGSLSIEMSIEKESLVILYSDDGMGLSDEATKKIFEPFYTTKRLIGGAGLGMHIVYNLVTHRLGGNICYLPNKKKGVSFKVTLPTKLTRE
jgi:C4-dicarboxylate-specific signal transduction histidine kinase